MPHRQVPTGVVGDPVGMGVAGVGVVVAGVAGVFRVAVGVGVSVGLMTPSTIGKAE